MGLGLVCWALGIPTVLSFNLWADYKPLASWDALSGFNPFEILDGLASNFLLPVCGLLVACFAAWRLDIRDFQSELGWRSKALLTLQFILRWVLPLLIVATLMTGYV